MRPSSPHALPLGESQPPYQPHAVSVSLPTWHSIVSWSRREEWVVKQMKSGYPRLFINSIIQNLSKAVLERFCHVHDVSCMILPSIEAAERLMATLTVSKPEGAAIEFVKFFLTHGSDPVEAQWSTFYAVLYPTDLFPEAMSFWRETGDGISSRHAEFCLERFDYLNSSSSDSSLCTSGVHRDLGRTGKSLPSVASTAADQQAIKTRIAESARSDDRTQPVVQPSDIYLYQKGLCAIYAVSRSLVPQELSGKPSEVVIYGWPYAETAKCIDRSGWGNVTHYGHSSKEELDDLESALAAGKQIQAVFCELPSNPQLTSPDLVRIRGLADKYGFVVACDETLGTSINVDVLPYVDIVMTSLTKIFSGACDVMGGSVLINPRSRFYEYIHTRIAALWEDSFFPLDVKILNSNSVDFAERVRFCSRSALAVATMVSKHPSVEHIYYPSLVPSRVLYDQCRRPQGGYGYVLSIIFKDPRHAVVFYDALDVCKGTSLGANFTLSVPYAQLAHFRELDLAESYGVPPHIVRISVGLDEEVKLQDRVAVALAAVEHMDST